VPQYLTFARPVQVPAWHEYVGQYFQYPSPWQLDWKRHVGGAVFYWLAHLERRLRGGRIGYCAPNLVCIAQRNKGFAATPVKSQELVGGAHVRR
jgi:hypothetical protein